MEDAIPQGTPVTGASPGHESNRIGLWGLLIFAVALILTVAVVEVVLGLVMKNVKDQQEPTDQEPSVKHVIAVNQFPTPRLQPNPMAELDQMKSEERQLIESYGWVDRKAGIARIPVNRALDILASKGLPKVAAPAPVPGAPPNTSIPPGTKRDEPGPEAKQGGKP